MLHRTAFASPLSLRCSVARGAALPARSPQRRPAAPAVPAAPRATRRVRMMMPPLGGFGPGGGALFESPIVRAEVEALERDQMALVEMGVRYGKFDFEGKIAYVDQMESCMERWLVLLARFRLDDSFASKQYVARLHAELEKNGMTVESLTQRSRESFEMMRNEARRTHDRL